MEHQSTAEEFARVIGCDECVHDPKCRILRDWEFNLPQPGFVGERYAETRIMLVAQNPAASPKRFNETDKDYAAHLRAVWEWPDAQHMQELNDFLRKYIPTWPIYDKSFPLAEAGIGVDEIAYVNLVRCRTPDNSVPSKTMRERCMREHFGRWPDWLSPKYVVFIGKWARDTAGNRLDRLGIPYVFINRKRSLSSDERRENRREVLDFLAKARQGSPIEATARPAAPKSKPTAQTKQDDGARIQQVTNAYGGLDDTTVQRDNGLNYEAYVEIFRSLGFESWDLRKMLQHPKDIPTVYFCRKQSGYIYFPIHRSQLHRFPASLWDRIPPCKKKDEHHTIAILVPKAGKQREAFEALIPSD